MPTKFNGSLGRLPRFTSLIVCSLSFTLCWSTVACAQEMTDQPLRPQQIEKQQVDDANPVAVSDTAEVLDDLASATVVYLGEQHDSVADHAAQLEIIQALHQRNPQVAIALEMFQQPFQPVIDQYLAGEISEAELREQTEYDQRWGFPWEYYAPILRYAQANDLPVIALNVPTEVTRQVAEKGLGSLTADQRQYIPPVDEIDLSDADYRALMLDIYKGFHAGHGAGTSFERFFLAQVLWDETMAAGIVNFLRQNPDYQVVTLAGQGHIVYDYGIPNRVERRLDARPDLFPDWSHRSVVLSPSEDLAASDPTNLADYLWMSDEMEMH
ncbi:MAG: ChaN family lipoprotein [Thainema sp.]